ncbi:class III signal peptide-containing protein [Thermococcus sp. JCM 11816]|uniref:class III signal peptide-containing protein n=1 Tax=Thermococcus sp. (strain JCM 11816 / KS-1) TaxID=1295125 RepID=UPI0006D001D1
MFRLKRRKGQGAIEYLFMIAAALVIILIAVRYVSQSGSQAQQTADISQLQAQVEMVKTRLVGSGIWNDDYAVVSDSTLLKIGVAQKDDNGKVTGVSKVIATANIDKSSDWASYTKLPTTLGQIYDDCQGGDEAACNLILDLSDAKKS